MILTFMQTCPNCGESNPDQARFCMACARPIAIPEASGLRKTVTIVFADLAGSTALGEALDSEALRELLDRYFDASRYPTLVSLEQQGAFDQPEGGLDYNVQNAVDSFEFGLPRVLDGVQTFVERRSATATAVGS